MTHEKRPDQRDTDRIAEQIAELVKIRDSAEKAMADLAHLKAAGIQRAGLNDDDVERAIALSAEVRRAEALLPIAEELVDLLHETRVDRGHQLILLFGEIATQTRGGELAPTGDELLRRLADLLEELYSPASKAAATEERAPPEEPPPATAP
jgi:hypothetical protein